MVFGALASLYSVANPPWEASDELGHFDYVVHILTTRTLPVQSVQSPNLAHHPPLYYLYAAALAWPADLTDPSFAPRFNPGFIWAGNGGRDPNVAIHTTDQTFPYTRQALALHLARLGSVVLGMSTVALLSATGRAAFPRAPAIGLLAVALIALDPEFLFVNGAVSNDSSIALAGSATFLAVLHAARAPERVGRWIVVGTCLGVAMLAKSSAVALLGAVGIFVLVLAAERRSVGWLVRAAACVAAPFVLLAGPWLARNQLLYGDPLGYAVYRRAWWPSLRTSPLALSDLREMASLQFRSFWAWFGWTTVPGPDWLHNAALALCALAAAGLVLILLGRRRELVGPWERRVLRLAALFAAAQELYMLAVVLDCNSSCYQGRYLFPVVAPIGLLLAAGLAALVPRPALGPTAALVAAALVAIALWVPFAVIRPAYATVPLAKWQLWRLDPIPATAVGDLFALRGWQVVPASDRATVAVTLYWQALRAPDFDYSAFVHLIDDHDQIVAQQDHAPGQPAGFPPTRWSTGDAVADLHELDLARVPPGRYRLRIGLYNWATGQQLPITIDGRASGTFLILPTPVDVPGR